MKKLSISLVAMLAIIFAVSSAFTSSLNTTYKAFANTESWGQQVPQPSEAIEALELRDFGTAVPTSGELEELDLNCQEDPIICYVVVKFEDDEPVEIVEVRDGIFQQ